MGKILLLIQKNLCSYIKSKIWTGRSLKILLLISFAVYLIHPGRFNRRYDHFGDYAIGNFLIRNKFGGYNCPVLLNASLEMIDFSESIEDEGEWAAKRNIEPGGAWSPKHCDPVFETALVVPYRNRNAQLSIFLSHIHQFLQKQLIKYRIFVIEQTPEKAFNRGKLMNIGFTEASKRGGFPCFIFHDVDLIPQVLKNIYACSDLPRHMSASINVWRYNLLYHDAFGGVIAILKDQFKKINGFSNRYFGWGAEDDDLLMRITNTRMVILRFSPEVSRYYMLPHLPEEKNPERFAMLKAGEEAYKHDGLNSLTYRVVNASDKRLFTHIVVEV